MLKKIVKKVINHKSPLDVYSYHIDQVNDKIISGWAHKKGEGNYTASIEIRHDNVILFSTKANEVREDLKAATIGTGRYGFSIDPTQIIPAHDVNEIDIFIDELKANAKPIPLTLVAKKTKLTKKPLTLKPVIITKDKLACKHQMHLDFISAEKVVGWAKKKDSVTHRVLVELKVGDIVIGKDRADTFRQSIKTAGIGDGSYCFEIKPLLHLFPQTTVKCDLYLDGCKMSRAPISLEVSEKELETAKFSEEFSAELSTFGGSITKELQRLTEEITGPNKNSVNVAIENIASLSVRVEMIEQILLKYLSNK